LRHISEKCGRRALVHEIKFDGYRVQVHVAHEAVKIFTLAATTGRLRKIADDAWHITAGSAIIEFSTCSVLERGRRMKKNRSRTSPT
jgi:ATP-dependent DNA ligase